MTDAERERLNEIARESCDMPMHPVDQAFLIELGRRLDKLEMIIPTFFNGRAADDDWLVRRDCVVRDEATKMAARECAKIVRAELNRISGDGPDLADVIARHFALEGGPTLTERVTTAVAQECVEIAEQVALDPEAARSQAETIINAINELHGFTASSRHDGVYTMQQRFTMPPTPAELDAAAGFLADLDEQITAVYGRAHEEDGR